MALWEMHYIMLLNIENPRERLKKLIKNRPKFKLSKNSREEPTEFEIVFIFKEVKYQYGFAFNDQRVTDEWLYAYPNKRGQNGLRGNTVKKKINITLAIVKSTLKDKRVPFKN